MNAVTVDEAQRDLKGLITKTIADADHTIIVSDTGEKVVFLSLDEFESWKGTLYLLSNPNNAEKLRQAIADADTGNLHPYNFSDTGSSGTNSTFCNVVSTIKK